MSLCSIKSVFTLLAEDQNACSNVFMLLTSKIKNNQFQNMYLAINQVQVV